MKIFKLSFAIALLFFISSCQKEKSFDTSGGAGGGGTNSGGTGTGDLLVRVDNKVGSETNYTLFEYDANKRLIHQKNVGKSQGIDISDELIIYRNADGIITSTVQKNPSLAQQGIDSSVTKVYYDNVAKKYTAKVFTLELAGLAVTDSTVLFYDNNGKVIKEELYMGMPGFGGSLDLSLVTEYTLTADGSIASMKQYDYSSGAADLVSEINYTYDDKVSPLILPSGEAAAITRIDYCANHNATKVDIIDHATGTGAGNLLLQTTYTYSTKNKPATSVMTQPGYTTNSTYTYK